MLPSVYEDDLTQDFEFFIQPTKTYRLNFDGTPSKGMLNGIEAMKQAVYLILNCERFQYEIFSWDYGIELADLIGEQNNGFLRSQLKNAITEALLQDDRITEVTDFHFSKEKQSLRVSFTVITTEGNVDSEFLWWGSGLEVIV